MCDCPRVCSVCMCVFSFVEWKLDAGEWVVSFAVLLAISPRRRHPFAPREIWRWRDKVRLGGEAV